MTSEPVDRLAAAVADLSGPPGRLFRLDELAPLSLPGPSRLARVELGTGADWDRAASDAEFRERFARQVPYLEGFDLAVNGLFCAGGCPAACLMRRPAAGLFDDVDFFLLRRTGANEALDALAAHLVAVWGDNLEIYRTTNFVTFYENLAKIRVQVVLTYGTAAELLENFDLGGVGFDGERVCLSAAGKLAAETGCLVPNWRTSHSSIYARLQKYAERGYALVFPRLDPALALEGFSRLRFEGATYVGGGVIRAAALRAEDGPSSGYTPAQVPYGDRTAVVRNNLLSLSGCMSGLRCAVSAFTPGVPVTHAEPALLQNDLAAFLAASAAKAQPLEAHLADMDLVYGTGGGRIGAPIPAERLAQLAALRISFVIRPPAGRDSTAAKFFQAMYGAAYSGLH